MEHLLTAPWFITVIGGALASLITASLLALISLFRPKIIYLYRIALTRTCKDINVSSSDKRLLQKALKNPSVQEAINTRASNPGEEALLLCKAIASLAAPPSPLSDAIYTASLVGHLLENEFRIEGTEKYKIFHDRHRDRHLYFEPPPAPAGLTSTAASQQITLTWNSTPYSSKNANVRRYHIARSTNLDGPFTMEVGIVEVNAENTCSFIDKDLRNGTTYYYVVTGESRLMKRGIPSLPVPAMPINPTLSDAIIPSNSELPSPIGVSSTFFTTREHLQSVAERCIGRERELDKLNSDFRDIGCRLVLIEGFGGLGKTTLASRFAINVSQHYNIFWVDGRGIPPTGERFLREMGKLASNQYKYPFLSIALEDSKLSLEDKENAFFEFLSTVCISSDGATSQPIAFFFDDFHLVGDPFLKDLVVKIIESKVIVKVVLIIRFLPLELQHLIDPQSSIQLEGLSLEDCCKLISVNSETYPALRHLENEKIQKIWELTGQGVPSALKIFVSMTRNLTVDDVFDELPSLTTVTRKEWFEKLFQELSIDEQQVAAEASIFRRPTLRSGLINISQCNKVKEVIESLVDRFVLIFDGKQYFMHALWAQYLRQHLSTADAKVLHRKAADYYHSFESTDRQAEIMSCLESCYHYIQAEDAEQAEKELISISSTLRSWGFFQEFTDILIEIEKDAKAKKRLLAPQLLLEKSSAMYANGDVEQAIIGLRELANKNFDEVKIKALLELGWIYTETGNRGEAERLLVQTRELAHQCNWPDLEERTLYQLQEIAYHRSEYKKALDYDQQRLHILEGMGNYPNAKEGIASIYHNIGNIYREQGFYEKALEYYEQFQPFWQELGNPYNRTGWLTYNIGEVYRDQGRIQEAIKQFENALQIFHKMHYIYGIAHVKIELGRVGVKLGSPDLAIQYVQEAIDIFRRINGKSGEAYALAALGEIHLFMGKLDLALQYLQDSILIEESLNNIKERARSLCLISSIYEQKGNSSLLSSGNSTETCSKFDSAAEAIAQAKDLFSLIDADTNIYGIHDAAARIQQARTECINSINR